MVNIEKLTKSSSKSRISKIVKKVKIIQEQHRPKIKIKTYKRNLAKKLIYKSANTNANVNANVNANPNINANANPNVNANENIKPIILTGNINIPNMEPIENISKKIINFKTQDKNNASVSVSANAISTTSDYIIVIPSYNRPDIIQVKTLALLNRHNIKSNLINIFVANQEQYDLYKAQIPAFLYNKLIIGVIGLRDQRNFIMDYYPEGTYIVQMDDDLDKIVELVVKSRSKSRSKSRRTRRTRSKSRKLSSIKELKPITNLDEFINNAFKMCKDKNIFLWGVYPLANSRFMTPTITTNLRFIVGPFWGIINRHMPNLKLTINEKENAERTLQHWVIDNAVLRFNNIGIETKYYKNKGGMQSEGKNRKEEALKSAYYLNKKYPNFTKIYLGKKSGVPEIRMIHSK